MMAILENGFDLKCVETSDMVLLNLLITYKITSQSHVMEWEMHQEFHPSEQLCRQAQILLVFLRGTFITSTSLVSLISCPFWRGLGESLFHSDK